jgi:hypothetical protein
MGALVRYLVRRQLPLLLLAVVGVVLVVWSFNAWGIAVWASVWSLAMVAAVALVQLVQGEGGTDKRLDAEEAERRAAIMRGDL